MEEGRASERFQEEYLEDPYLNDPQYEQPFREPSASQRQPGASFASQQQSQRQPGASFASQQRQPGASFASQQQSQRQPASFESQRQPGSPQEQYQLPTSTEKARSPAEEEERKFLARLLLIALICLCLVGGGAVVAMVLLFTDVLDNGDDTSAASKDGGTLTGSSNNVPPTYWPTKSPTISGGGSPSQPSPSNPTAPNPTPTTTMQPAPAPTTASPTKQKLWKQVGGLLKTRSSQLDTKFGFSVAMAGSDFLAVGEPGLTTSGTGDVTILDRSSNWGVGGSGLSVGTTLEFGYSVDAAIVGGNPSLLVGATQTVENSAQYGSAQYYQRDSSGSWSPLGNTIRPPLVSSQTGGMFGAAVTLASNIPRIAIGAPNTTVASAVNTGQVYTYNLVGSLWTPMADPLDGLGSDRRFGASVALSQDGSRLLIGSPGHKNGSGAIFYYQWTGTLWKSILQLAGESGEGIGTTVAIISDDADMIAWGGPAYGGDTGQGMVSVFRESPPGFFAKINNQDILGSNGDRIGTTLSGSKGRVAFGTETGSVNVYEHNGISWAQVSTAPNLGSPVVSISMSDDGNSVAVGTENRNVAVYDLE